MTEEIDIERKDALEAEPDFEDGDSDGASEAKTPSEKLYSAEHVKNVAKRNRYAGYKKGRQDAMNEVTQIPAQHVAPQAEMPMQQPTPPAPVQAMPQAQPQYQQPQQQMGGMPIMTPEMQEAIRQETMRATQSMMQHAQASQVINEFSNKLMATRDKYPDFDEKVSALQIHNLPPMLVALANKVDNTGDVMYDLANNPHKIGQIMSLAQMPHLAELEMQKLATSIKANEQAKAQAQGANVSAPLSQISTSNTGTDNGKKTVNDLRKAKYLRV